MIHREKVVTETDATQSTSGVDQTAGGSLNLTTTKVDRTIAGAGNNFSNTAVNTTLLPTASVLIKSRSDRHVRVWALLDQGSQASFVTESVVQTLKADLKTVSVHVTGIGGSKPGIIKKLASFTVEPCALEGLVLPFKAFVLPKLTSYSPISVTIDDRCAYLNNLLLADTKSPNTKSIDLIIGADYYEAVLRKGLIHGTHGNPTAQLTIFGWVISGPLHGDSQKILKHGINVNHIITSDSLNESLRDFWELEEVSSHHVLSDEEARCEDHFVKTHSRLSNGYVVKLPFKTDLPIQIGETKQIARRIYLSNESRIARQPELAKAY